MKRWVGVDEEAQKIGNDVPATVLAAMPAVLLPLLSPTFAAIRTQQGAVSALLWSNPLADPYPPIDGALLVAVRAWLADYFAGHFRAVSFPIVWRGTGFQRRLGEQLAAIPPGQTVSYGVLAQRMGSAPRAVGRGLGANPLPLLLPCHRVVAATGLGGFSAPGGVETKRWLLAWERCWSGQTGGLPIDLTAGDAPGLQQPHKNI